jgi:hypothetical protein
MRWLKSIMTMCVRQKTCFWQHSLWLLSEFRKRSKISGVMFSMLEKRDGYPGVRLSFDGNADVQQPLASRTISRPGMRQFQAFRPPSRPVRSQGTPAATP